MEQSDASGFGERLAEVGETLGALRVLVLPFEGSRVLTGEQWCAPGNAPAPSSPGGVPTDLWPEWYRATASGEELRLDDIAALGPAWATERDWSISQGVLASLTVPIVRDGVVRGGILVHAGSVRRWTDADAELLASAARLAPMPVVDDRWALTDFEALPVALVVFEESGRIAAANAAARAFFRGDLDFDRHTLLDLRAAYGPVARRETPSARVTVSVDSMAADFQFTRAADGAIVAAVAPASDASPDGTPGSSVGEMIAAGWVYPAYQPVIDADGGVLGVEALCRATHPEHGPVSVDAFIASAERTGAIVDLDHHVIETACHEFVSLAASGLWLSVNVSPTTLAAGFADFVAGVLERTGFPAASLHVEVTESTRIDTGRILGALHALDRLGVVIAADDFGTGFCTLATLIAAPVSLVKVDRTLVTDVATDDRARRMLDGVVALANSLGMDVIVEGVETEAQRRAVVSSGAQGWQGYLCSRPVPLEQLVEVVQALGRHEDDDATLDALVLERSAGGWRVVGGVGRGASWAGIVTVSDEDAPIPAEVPAVLESETPVRVVGPFWATRHAVVALDERTRVVLGGPELDPGSTPERLVSMARRARSEAIVGPAKRLADELEVLHALRTLLDADHDGVDEVLAHVATVALEALSSGYAFVTWRGRLATAGDVPDADLAALASHLADRGIGTCCVEDLATSTMRFPAPLVPESGALAAYVVPIAADGLLVVVHTHRSRRGFTDLCRHLGRQIAAAAETAIGVAERRARLVAERDRATVDALVDPLTEVANRRAWERRLSGLVGSAAVLLVDVGALKSVNDRCGLAVGDLLLCDVARALLDSAPEGSLVARLGGDEFAVLLSDASEADAETTIARTRGRLRSLPQTRPYAEVDLHHGIGAVGTGIGVSVAMAAADAGLLRSKEHGQGTRARTTVTLR